MTKATRNPQTREDISNPHRHIPHEVLLVLANVTDLRDNHTIEELPNGRIRVHAIDDSKKFIVESSDVQAAVDAYRRNQDPELWARGVAKFICAEDKSSENATRQILP